MDCIPSGRWYSNISHVGTGFTTFELPPPLKKLAIGICMDLNPNPASSETLEKGNASDVVRELYELAEFCIEQGVDTLVIPCAWLDSEEGTDWDIGTVNYWCHRLQPLWSKSRPSDDEHTGGRQTAVIICNRAGFERGEFWLIRSLGRPRERTLTVAYMMQARNSPAHRL